MFGNLELLPLVVEKEAGWVYKTRDRFHLGMDLEVLGLSLYKQGAMVAEW